MPSKKAKPEPDRGKPPPSGPPEHQQGAAQDGATDSTNGLSGRGVDSVLAHLIELEKTRGRKPERS